MNTSNKNRPRITIMIRGRYAVCRLSDIAYLRLSRAAIAANPQAKAMDIRLILVNSINRHDTCGRKKTHGIDAFTQDAMGLIQ